MKTWVENGISLVSPQELRSAMGSVRIIDVRRADEFNGELGHISGAELATLGPELTTLLQTVSRDTKIVFVCRSGARSGSATEESKKLGFTHTVNMKGGMILWNAENLPIERTNFNKEKQMKFQKNVHSVERVVRIVVGLGLTSLAFVGPANLWFLLGIIPVLTGIVGWCPPYALLGINTCGTSCAKKE